MPDVVPMPPALPSPRAARGVKAKAVKMTPDMTVAGAFKVIARACLDQVAANQPAVLAGAAEGVHQMRVGVRRLRSALSTFSPVFADDDAETAGVVADLKALMATLGPARDADVFLDETLPPVMHAFKGAAAFGPALRHFEAERARHRRAAQAAVGDDGFADMLHRAAVWVESGAWLNGDDTARAKRLAKPVEKFAVKRLARRHRKVLARGDGFRDLAPDDRHALRIALKKLRYSSEFFSALFATKKVKRFKRHMKPLQDRLGDLNDIAVARARLMEPGPDPAVAWVSGLVLGWQAQREAVLVEEIAQAFDAFSRAEPYWS